MAKNGRGKKITYVHGHTRAGKKVSAHYRSNRK